MTPSGDLEALRHRIRRIDDTVIRLAAERVQVARQVGEAKRRAGLPTVDFAQERRTLDRARADAARHGLAADVAEDLLARLIRASVTVQEADRVQHAAVGTGRAALVVGGAGRMGAWFVRFLAALGYRTAVLDPAATGGESAPARDQLADADLIVCATPPSVTADWYRTWAAGPPPGVIVDIASIKTPLVDGIRGLQAAGARVASIHPLFGPGVVLLRDADVVICEVGDAGAQAAVEALFTPTTARLIRLPVEDHDRVMADLLALAHATAIAFALALPATDHPVRSTTFQALERLAASVVRESPAVYFEIQAANPHAAAAVERLRVALDRLTERITAGDASAFAALMAEGARRTPAPD